MRKKIFRSHKSLFSFLIVFLLFINLFILCEDNLIVWIKAVYRNSQLQEEKKYYIEQIDKTTKEMEQFYQDHSNIERLAREKYKMLGSRSKPSDRHTAFPPLLANHVNSEGTHGDPGMTRVSVTTASLDSQEKSSAMQIPLQAPG